MLSTVALDAALQETMFFMSFSQVQGVLFTFLTLWFL